MRYQGELTRAFFNCLFLLVCLPAAWCVAQDEADSRNPQFFGLRTEYFPAKEDREGFIRSRMLREIARQSVLTVAREDLGLWTRDETLDEPLPAAGPEQPGPHSIRFRAFYGGTCELTLTAVRGSDSESDLTLWQYQEEKVPGRGDALFPELIDRLSARSNEISEAIESAGFAKNELIRETVEPPGEDVLNRLAKMDFVSQYSAVQEAHRALRRGGPSADWLGVIVRGYANLSMLTQHHWSSYHEVFAARSLLYANRLLQLDEASPEAQRHQAYAMAIIGLHRAALGKLEALPDPKEASPALEITSTADLADAAIQAEEPAEDSSPETASPAWHAVIEPLCRFDADGLSDVVASHPSAKELVARLRWEVYRAHVHGRWIYEKGNEATATCPEAYGAYSVMAKWSALRIQRTGAWGAVEAFGARMPKRLGKLDNLPSTARAFLPKPGGWAQLFGLATQESTVYSPAPIKAARALRDHAQTNPTPEEPSWAVLASLIAEEQFVQIANIMKVSGNSVEYSKEQMVQQILPLVEGHRYANFIKSYAFNSRNEPERFQQTLGDMKVVDYRGNMMPMLRKLWSYDSGNMQNVGKNLSWRAMWDHSFNFPGFFESVYIAGDYWLQHTDADMTKALSGDITFCSPHSPNALLNEMQYGGKESTPENLADWESRAGSSPVAWLSLGQKHYQKSALDEAIRCFKISLEISPCFSATDWLAEAYFHNGQEELRVPTLKSYLEYEDLGLAHAQIHQRIANYLIAVRDWEGAKPHALEAAGTWSAWGLLLGAKVHEGLGEWEQSEYFVSEATQGYPSYTSGPEWYFWCRRNGRGDVESAKDFAERWSQLNTARSSAAGTFRLATYHTLEGNFAEAASLYEDLNRHCSAEKSPLDKVWYLAHLTQLQADLGDRPGFQKSLAELRKTAEAMEKNEQQQGLANVVLALCDLHEGTEHSGEELELLLRPMAEFHQCNYNYFYGKALQSLGHDDDAELCWRRAAFHGPFDYINSTLAGDELVMRYGDTRGGPPPEPEPELESEPESEAQADSG